jgi:hypothetical protein
MTISPAIDFVTAAFGTATEAPVFTLVLVAATTIAGTGRSPLVCRWRAMLTLNGDHRIDRGGDYDTDGGDDRHADREDDRQDDVELLPARGVDGGDARDVECGEHRLAEVDEDRHAGGSEDDLASAKVGVGLAAFVASTQDIDTYLVKQGRARSTDGVRS